MALVDIPLHALQESPVAFVLLDSGLQLVFCNLTAQGLMPELTLSQPMDTQFPSLHWLTVPSSLRLMRPCSLMLLRKGGNYSLTLLPLFKQGSFDGALGVISPAVAPALDPAYAMALHDLRTPISSICSCAELLQEHVSDHYAPYLNIIWNNAQHMRRTLYSIASSLDDSAVSTRLEPTDPVAVLSSAVGMVMPLLGDSGLSLYTCLQGSALAMCDGAQLERVCMNLLSNAIKFAAHSIRVHSEVSDREVVLRVWNDGPGIPPADLPHIFTAWFVGDHGVPGSGLGLPTAALLARLNGGRLDVTSGDPGTEFVLRLPLAQEAELSVGQGAYRMAAHGALMNEVEGALAARAAKDVEFTNGKTEKPVV